MIVREHPHPYLQMTCKLVECLVSINPIAQSMLHILFADDSAVGLAAPQVGSMRQIIVIDPEPTHNNEGKRIESKSTRIMYNPQILILSNEKDIKKEGCLSFPGWSAPVERSQHIVVEYMTIVGKRVREDFSGWTARVVQHEIDHLHGKTIFDQTNRTARKTYQKKVKR